jgi:hypothetical protein
MERSMTPRYVETDADHHELCKYVQLNTCVSYSDAREVLGAIKRCGFRLQFPERHPSGLDTTAHHPTTTVVPTPAKILGLA